VTLGALVVTAGDPSPKSHVYVHPLVVGESVTVSSTVALEPPPAQPSTATVKLEIFGHVPVDWQTRTTVSVAEQAPSEQVARTLICFPHGQRGLEKVAVQFPVASTGTSCDVGELPQSIVTLISPVAQPLAVPLTTIDDGSVAPGGRNPTTEVIVTVHAIGANRSRWWNVSTVDARICGRHRTAARARRCGAKD